MVIIGLTGSIATGKTFVARCFAKLGAKVFDADEAAHELLTYQGKAVKKVRELFPTSYDEGCIDRKKLGTIVFADDKSRILLEEIMHPLIIQMWQKFIDDARKQRISVIILEIPLLFELKAKFEYDHIITTIADPDVQRSRALAREGMSEERFEAINSLQMDSAKKAERSDFVIDTTNSEFAVFRKVKEIMRSIR